MSCFECDNFFICKMRENDDLCCYKNATLSPLFLKSEFRKILVDYKTNLLLIEKELGETSERAVEDIREHQRDTMAEYEFMNAINLGCDAMYRSVINYED